MACAAAWSPRSQLIAVKVAPAAATIAAVSSIAERPTPITAPPALRDRHRDALADAGIGAGDHDALAGQAEGGKVAHRRSCDRHRIDVGVVDIVAGHRPDEGVVRGAGAGMDRPARRQHRLLALHHDMPRLVRLAHEVEHPRRLRQVEIEIDLHAPVVDVARHGVPHRARRELRHADHELAGAGALGVDELEDRALVGGRLAAEIDALGIADADVPGRMVLMRRRAEQVEFGRMRRPSAEANDTASVPMPT